MDLETNKKFVLLDGKKFSSKELTKFYKDNLRSGKIPVAGYFCPLCHHEVILDTNFVYTHCDIKFKKQ